MILTIFKMLIMFRLIWVMIVFLCVKEVEGTCPGKSLKGVVELKTAQEKSTMFEELLKVNVTIEFEISPGVIIVNLVGVCTDKQADRKIKSIKRQFPNQVNSIERLRIYEDTLMPSSSNKKYDLHPTNLVCDHYYGMGVEQVWDQGITGRGVVISILDVGVNTDLEEFKHSVDKTLSYNYVNKTRDVTPEYYPELSTSRSPMTDHGNQIFSIIAAAKDNGICGAGIAYGSTIAVRKIFTVTYTHKLLRLHPSHWTSSDIIANAIVENVTNISVSIMAWSPVNEHYDLLDTATQNAIKRAAEVGRNGYGTLMFTPAGTLGNGVANNIHTITVGGMSKDGGIPDSSFGDASVIACGLTDGTNLTSSKMVTTTLQNRCVTGFAGVSAATAQVGAIYALALEANPRLSLRDAQHILVRTSDYQGLIESRDFKQNGAGLHFHGVLGFGKANATRLVALAKTWETVPPLLTKTLNDVFETIYGPTTKTFMFKYDCMETDAFCLQKLEHVQVNMKLRIKAKKLGMAVVSPDGTTSVLIDPSIEQNVSGVQKEVQLVTVHFWDEKPMGDWKVVLDFKCTNGPSEIDGISITLYGTGVRNMLIQQQRTKTAATTTPKPVNHVETTESGADILFSNLSLMVLCFLASYVCAIYGQ